MAAKQGAGFGTVVAAIGVVVIAWMGIRKMTEAQRALVAPSASATNPGPVIVPTIPPALLADAGKQPILRLDVTLRVDGVDVTANGAAACRDGHRRLIGRAGAAGSFDEPALLACLQQLQREQPGARPIALLSRAGPAVPTTYLDALTAAVRRAGIADVVATQ